MGIKKAGKKEAALAAKADGEIRPAGHDRGDAGAGRAAVLHFVDRVETASSPTRTRTLDTRINSPLLYQLSYRGSFVRGLIRRGGRDRLSDRGSTKLDFS